MTGEYLDAAGRARARAILEDTARRANQTLALLADGQPAVTPGQVALRMDRIASPLFDYAHGGPGESARGGLTRRYRVAVRLALAGGLTGREVRAITGEVIRGHG